MKYTKLFLASLAAGFCITNAAYADRLFTFSPNNIPQTISFNIAQPNNGDATMAFPNSILPVKFSCYFASTPKGFSAFFSSDQDDINFMAGTDSTLQSGTTDVKMFTVTRAKNRQAMGKVNIQVTSDNPRSKNATLICMMAK